MQNDDKYIMMTETPIKKLIPRLSIPTIVSMLVTSIYNITDTFFVSQISTSAAGAVGIIFSLMAIIQAVGYTFAMGSGALISSNLGKRDIKSAEQAGATAFFTSIFLGLLLALGGLLYLEGLVYALGATETIAPYAKDYGFYILIGAPCMCSTFVLNLVQRSQGNTLRSMIGISVGGLLNIILDPILIFGFNMGISGAAIATIASQFVSFGILFMQTNCIHGSIKIKFSNFSISIKMYRNILKTGLPTFYRQGLASIASVLLNLAALPYGDPAIAAVSIVMKIIMFLFSALMGFGQGYMIVAGFNYGAKKYRRNIEAFWFSVKVGFMVLFTLSVFFFTFAPQIISVFRRDDLEVIRIASRFLRFQCMILPLHSFIIIINMTLQSLGFTLRAAIAASAHQGLFFIPCILILPKLFGLTGILISQSVADIFTFILNFILIMGFLKELKGKV